MGSTKRERKYESCICPILKEKVDIVFENVWQEKPDHTGKCICRYAEVVLFQKCSGFNKCGINRSYKKDIQPNQGNHNFFIGCPLNEKMKDDCIQRNLHSKH